MQNTQLKIHLFLTKFQFFNNFMNQITFFKDYPFLQHLGLIKQN